MKSKHVLQRKPAPAEYKNSAGRLIRVLEMLRTNATYYDAIAEFYGHSPQRQNIANELKTELYFDFMRFVGDAFEECFSEIDGSENLPTATKAVLRDGLSKLNEIVYPMNPGTRPREMQGAELALLRMAGTMLPQEDELRPEAATQLNESISDLQNTIEATELPTSVRTALLEIVRLSRNAVDQFNIYGTRGFNVAFKKMLAELMEVYLKEGGKKLETQNWWQKTLKHVKLVDKVASELLKYQPLLEHVGAFLAVTSG